MDFNLTVNVELSSVSIDDEEIAKAYEKGGMGAVEDLVQQYADDRMENPCWIPDSIYEDAVKRLVERLSE